MSPTASLQVDKPIVLVGLMGCGKSSIGKRLAKMLALPFIDLDVHIEAVAGMKISEIFKTHGQAHFRQLELQEMNRIITNGPMIIASGGGAFINDKIRQLLKDKVVSIWIKADLKTLLERVSRNNSRPLLENGDKEQILKDLIAKRYPIYEQADIKVDTSRSSHDVVLRRIIEALKNEF